jgi:hypothetical protein
MALLVVPQRKSIESKAQNLLSPQTKRYWLTMAPPSSPRTKKRISLVNAFRLFAFFQAMVILLLYDGLVSYKKEITEKSENAVNGLKSSLPLVRFPFIPMKRGDVDKCLWIVEKKDNNTVKKPQPYRCLIHLHIGKNGGTSLDGLFKHDPRIQENVHQPYIGNRHFDWSYLMGAPPAVKEKMDVLLMLRHPVHRAVSHFYFSKQLALKEQWKQERLKMTKKERQLSLRQHNNNATIFINATLSELLFSQDPNITLFDNRDIWQDGQAAVSWITGTHIANWVMVPPEQILQREQLTLPQNVPSLLHLAADRLESTLWFGIMEDIPRSMELLSFALGLHKHPQDYVEWKLPKANQGKIHHPNVTQREYEALSSLMPQDLWLYEYGKRLFDYRWQAYTMGPKQQHLPLFPERPPMPIIPLTCWSWRFIMNCTSGPLQGNYQYNHMPTFVNEERFKPLPQQAHM